LRGTWSASLGVDLVVLSGTTAVTLDGTPGLPGFIAPAVTLVGEAQVPLHGLARGSKWLERREPLWTWVRMRQRRAWLRLLRARTRCGRIPLFTMTAPNAALRNKATGLR